MVYVFAVVGSSTFHTVCLEFSHAFEVESWDELSLRTLIVPAYWSCARRCGAIVVGEEIGHRNLRLPNDYKLSAQLSFEQGGCGVACFGCFSKCRCC